MIAPAHYAIGAASALFVQKYLPTESGPETRIAWALAVAIGSHVIADAIPHAEHFLRGSYLLLELVAWTVIMFVVLAGTSRSPFVTLIILTGMVGAAIPDGLGMLSRATNVPLLLWVDGKIHFYHGRLNLFYANLFLQSVITILCSYYVRQSSSTG